MHFGIIPRTNRGIFAINELPDLAPRIQVGLLNLLEERDFQIRGFPVRIPMDVLMVFTANPEDYTNRGSIITPLKDRIAFQILTHYPRTIEDAKTVTEDQAWLERGPELPEVVIPSFIADVVEEIAFKGRESEYIDQSSGVSARLPIAARELLVSQVENRLLRNPKNSPVARLVDLGQVVPAVTGKVELVYEGEQEGSTTVSRHLIGNACRAVFDRYFPDVIKEGSEPGLKSDRYKPVLDWFTVNNLELSDMMDDLEYTKALSGVPGLGKLAREFLPSEDELLTAVAMELILEGLHQHSLLAKEDAATGVSYSDMLGIMLEGLK
jgi:magnesium chelatase subunit I